MAEWLDRLGFEVMGALVATPLIFVASALGTALWHRLMATRPASLPARRLDLADLVALVVAIAAFAGCILLSAGAAKRLFGVRGDPDWTLAAVLSAWLLYGILSTVVGFLVQGILATVKGRQRDVSPEGAAGLRERRFMITLFTKVVFLIFFAGWALLAPAHTLFQPLTFGFFAFQAVDALGIISLLLVD